MSKISELSDGGVIQGGDTLIAVRSGGNVKVTYGGSTTANIDGGTIDGTVIGGSTPAALSATTGSFSSTLGVTAAATFASTLKTGGGAASNTSKLMVNTVSGTAAGIQLFQDANESWIIENTASSTNLTFANSGTTRLTINGSTGAVGIGVSSPANKLDVRNTSTDYQLHLGDTASTVLGYELGRENTGGLFKFYGNQTGATGYIFSGVDGERMRIDASGNVGIGTSSPSVPLDIKSANSASIKWQRTGVSAKEWGFVSDNDQTYLYNFTDGITSTSFNNNGNVGIGVTPLTKLHVQDSTGSPQIRIDNQGTASGIASLLFRSGGAGNPSSIIQSGGTSSGNQGIVFKHGDFGAEAELMRIDSSGKVGIGVVPSTDHNPVVEALQIGSTANLFGRNDAEITTLTSNSYLSVAGYPKYITTNEASEYTQISGNHIWYNAPSGTAGATCTQTERMRIDSSGNLLVGDTSTVPFDGTSGVLIGGARTSLAFATTGHTHKMLYSVNTGTAGLHFYDSTNNRTDMIWDNSGNLLVGTTTNLIWNTTNLTGCVIGGNSSSGGFSSIQVSRVSDLCLLLNRLTSDGQIQAFARQGTQVGEITVTTSSTSYNTSSDYRLKENIADADDAGSKIDAIKVRKFDWKADGSHQDYGMVAQELMTVAPEAVHQPEDPEQMMGVDYSKLVPMMLKEIQSLRARISQLEGAK